MHSAGLLAVPTLRRASEHGERGPGREVGEGVVEEVLFELNLEDPGTGDPWADSRRLHWQDPLKAAALPCSGAQGLRRTREGEPVSLGWSAGGGWHQHSSCCAPGVGVRKWEVSVQ